MAEVNANSNQINSARDMEIPIDICFVGRKQRSINNTQK